MHEFIRCSKHRFDRTYRNVPCMRIVAGRQPRIISTKRYGLGRVRRPSYDPETRLNFISGLEFAFHVAIHAMLEELREPYRRYLHNFHDCSPSAFREEWNAFNGIVCVWNRCEKYSQPDCSRRFLIQCGSKIRSIRAG